MVPGSIPGDRISQPMQRKTQIETSKQSTYLVRPISSFKSMYLCMACMSHQFQRYFWFTAFAFRQIRWGISEGLKNNSGKTHPMALQSARVSVYDIKFHRTFQKLREKWTISSFLRRSWRHAMTLESASESVNSIRYHRRSRTCLEKHTNLSKLCMHKFSEAWIFRIVSLQEIHIKSPSSSG